MKNMLPRVHIYNQKHLNPLENLKKIKTRSKQKILKRKKC